MADVSRSRRLKTAFVWALTALVLVGYIWLPSPRGVLTLEPASKPSGTDTEQKLDITSVTPPDPAPGDSIIIEYEGGSATKPLNAYIGRQKLRILSRHSGRLVARLPGDVELGRAKIRVAIKKDRSKPYDISISELDRRGPFGRLVGGLALLFLGIGAFSRGAREGIGVHGAQRVAGAMRRRPVTAVVGMVLGLFAQSTTAVAGMLAGLFSSRLFTGGAAAVAFLGAVVGASASPLVVGLFRPRDGLLLLGLGMLWMSLGSDRRARSIGRLLLGAGMIAFGLQLVTLAAGPWASSSSVLPWLLALQSEHFLGALTCVALGVVLSAFLQGPAPVYLLILSFVAVTGTLDGRAALLVLSGSGLGAAIASLITTWRGRDGASLSKLQLTLGLASTLLMALGTDIWLATAKWLTNDSSGPLRAGRVWISELGLELSTAFGVALLATTVVVIPLARPLERFFGSKLAARRACASEHDAEAQVRSALVRIFRYQLNALGHLRDLALTGERNAGREAEHALADARQELEVLLAGPAHSLKAQDDARLAKASWGTLQTTAALEQLLLRSERFTDQRLAYEAGSGDLLQQHAPLLNNLHDLLSSSLKLLLETVREGTAIDVETVRAREIRINSYETETRNAFIDRHLPADAARQHAQVLELVDAYEATGNHLYRLAETLTDDSHAIAVSA